MSNLFSHFVKTNLLRDFLPSGSVFCSVGVVEDIVNFFQRKTFQFGQNEDGVYKTGDAEALMTPSAKTMEVACHLP